jgi:AAA15 family ATPase/GTPase
MLEKVGFKNFLALRDVEIDLEPFTVIVGPNSSGKSTILEGISRITNPNGSNNMLIRYSSDGFHQNDPSFFLSKSYKEPIISFLYKDHSSLVEWNLNITDGTASIKPSSSSFNPKMQNRILVFSASEAAKPSYSESLTPQLEHSGQGLATVCSYLQDPNPDAFARVQKSLSVIIPNLNRFRMRPARVLALDWFNIDTQNRIDRINRNLTGTGHELIFDFENAEGIPASQVSEGTLFALTVLVTAASSSEDTVILIDDLERGLHPKAVGELMTALREIQKLKPGLQIIATSHSPYVLHSLKPKEVRVVTLDPARGTLVAPLEAYPEFDKWRDAMTPGEFWSFVGEDWVKDLPTLEKTSV